MIALDIGGTKTLAWFSCRKRMDKFLRYSHLNLKKINHEEKICIFDTNSINKIDIFFEFVSLLKSLDENIISTFPGIVEMELGEKPRFKVFSKRFPFLIGNYLDFDFVINDAPAFTYYHALSFFNRKENKDKTLLGVVIGTGVNAAYMNYWDFRRLNFINRFFEAGHISFDRSSNTCFCGRSGCAELYLSGRYLEKLGNGDPREVFMQDDLKEKYYSRLADYIISLIVTISPHEMVFGGGVSKDLNLKELKQMVENNFPHSKMKLNINFRKDVSALSNVKGLIEIYRSFRRIRRFLY